MDSFNFYNNVNFFEIVILVEMSSLVQFVMTGYGSRKNVELYIVYIYNCVFTSYDLLLLPN